MVADSDFWTLATVLPLNRGVLVYIVDDVQLINSAPNIEIQASANFFDIPHMSAPNIEIQASTNSFDIPHMFDPFGIFEGFLEQAYEGDREQDNLVEAEKTKGKNTSGKCNGNRKASRNTEPFPDLGFGDVETDYEDSVGFRSGSSSSSEGEQPVKLKKKTKGKNTSGKCNGKRKASRNTEPFPDLGFGDVETDYEDFDGFRSGSS
ncbi:hypothetical protein EV2_006406 [Malus domestica]